MDEIKEVGSTKLLGAQTTSGAGAVEIEELTYITGVKAFQIMW